jgi:multidrug efflux pump
MTSLAFIFGVLPLAISTGAGAHSRVEIGTAVIGGMLTATVLAIFYIPLFFVFVRKIFRKHALTPEERIAADEAYHHELETRHDHRDDGEQPA